MKMQTIDNIESIIFALKSGQSIHHAIQGIHLPNYKNPNQYTAIEYELSLIINRGKKGLPILKNLEQLLNKAHKKLVCKIEEHTKKAPFLALIPLFLFQLPALGLSFFYPLISKFIEEISL